jgi:hypothetical protein
MNFRNRVIDEIEDAWLGLTNDDLKKAVWRDPLKTREEDRERYGITPVRMMTNPEYLSAAAKILLNVELLPIQSAIMSEMWTRPFPMLIGSRGLGKTTLLAFYSLLKMALTPKNSAGGPGVKIVITGAGFRQAKQVFEYMEGVYSNSPILRSLCYGADKNAISRESDRYTIRIGPNNTIAIPLGNGEKVRGLRANIVLADEFNSISPEIFETVIQGFAAVAANPIEVVKRRAKIAKAKSMGIDLGIKEQASNQIIISGTCGYDFEHFADYWKKYKVYIESMGDERKLLEVFPEGVPNFFNWKDYSVIRIPYTKVPAGFLDEKILVRAQATLHSGTFQREFGAVFSKDSQGFFRRTLIDSCVANHKNINRDDWCGWCPEPFDCKLSGRADKKYVIAIDPASEIDKCSIVVLEMWENHARIVYCWTSNKKEHRELVRTNMTKENDFYAYVARKIRQLRIAFPSDHISIDAQGGGIGIMEALHNKNNITSDEELFWPVSDNKNNYDYEKGPKIIYPVQFANYEWTQQANHGLKQDMEGRTILFPQYDPVSMEMASAKDYERVAEYERNNPGVKAKAYDTLEDCVFEIEELKDELTTIDVVRTGTGPNSRERWDTPEIKLANAKKGRLRKDRYSALVIGNMMARQLRIEKGVLQSGAIGGLLARAGKKDGSYYDYAPQDYIDAMTPYYDSL